jgi:hypothetical protein
MGSDTKVQVPFAFVKSVPQPRAEDRGLLAQPEPDLHARAVKRQYRKNNFVVFKSTRAFETESLVFVGRCVRWDEKKQQMRVHHLMSSDVTLSRARFKYTYKDAESKLTLSLLPEESKLTPVRATVEADDILCKVSFVDGDIVVSRGQITPRRGARLSEKSVRDILMKMPEAVVAMQYEQYYLNVLWNPDRLSLSESSV